MPIGFRAFAQSTAYDAEHSITFNLNHTQVETPQGELPSIDTSHVYHGELLGEPSTLVHGSIHDGVFEGKIITDQHAYYVENAKHYFPNRTHLDYGFHSVIYNERDVIDDPYAERRKGMSISCKFRSSFSRDIPLNFSEFFLSILRIDFTSLSLSLSGHFKRVPFVCQAAQSGLYSSETEAKKG